MDLLGKKNKNHNITALKQGFSDASTVALAWPLTFKQWLLRSAERNSPGRWLATFSRVMPSTFMSCRMVLGTASATPSTERGKGKTRRQQGEVQARRSEPTLQSPGGLTTSGVQARGGEPTLRSQVVDSMGGARRVGAGKGQVQSMGGVQWRGAQVRGLQVRGVQVRGLGVRGVQARGLAYA